jgi:hypothetical protein
MSTNPPAPVLGLNPPPVQPSATPPAQPVLPPTWTATAVLHPFSPPPMAPRFPFGPVPENPWPFFELCIANVAYVENQYLSVQLLGASQRTWWFYISQEGTSLSTDEGANFKFIDTGWAIPPVNWVPQEGRYFASGPLNWMEGAPSVDWWTQPVAGSNAATWIWYDTITQAPVRMMFGAPPPSYTTGTADQLAVFQNFSFTYFPTFSPNSEAPLKWVTPNIPTFEFGNPADLQLFVWSSNFGMSPMMTPVNFASNPLPTTTLYHWTPDSEYQELTDRAQKTTMSYVFNSTAPKAPQVDTALMFGAAPAAMPDPSPFAGHWFDYTQPNSGPTTCMMDPEGLVLGAEAPDWVSTSGEAGTIGAMISNDPVMSPNNAVEIVSVLFPASTQYPQGRFLWTWYSPTSPDGTSARPVTFMESASSISEGGTSLALADYYDYQVFGQPIPPSEFDIPPACNVSAKEAPAAPDEPALQPA